jgi:uncharacterized protein (DUF1697 family)
LPNIGPTFLNRYMKYVAFLRGVNVGGRVIKMADLKDCLKAAGFGNVTTYLQSGNVVFESDKTEPHLKAELGALFTETFKYPARVQVISMEKLREIIAANPFAAAPADFHQYVIFIENDLETQLVEEAGKQLGEDVKAGQNVVYWKIQKGQTLKTPFAKLLTKSKYKEFNTNRNLNTLQKIAAGG